MSKLKFKPTKLECRIDDFNFEISEEDDIATLDVFEKTIYHRDSLSFATVELAIKEANKWYNKKNRRKQMIELDVEPIKLEYIKGGYLFTFEREFGSEEIKLNIYNSSHHSIRHLKAPTVKLAIKIANMWYNEKKGLENENP